jgi:hypothetical protein
MFFVTGQRGLVSLVRQPQNKYNDIYICMVIYCKNYGEGRWCGSRNICNFVQILQLPGSANRFLVSLLLNYLRMIYLTVWEVCPFTTHSVFF